MTFRVEIDGQIAALDIQRQGNNLSYEFDGALNASGLAALVQISPGVFSVLIGNRSFTVHLAQTDDHVEATVGSQRHAISIADFRDASPGKGRNAASGPTDIRAQMPGKVISLLVAEGSSVEEGQGLLIIEAMKMQNELKSPRAGVVMKMPAREGMTVIAGETLAVIG